MIRAAGMARNDSKTSSEVSISRNNELMTIPAPPLHQHRDETFEELIPRSSNVYLVFIFLLKWTGNKANDGENTRSRLSLWNEITCLEFGSQKWKISLNEIIPVLWSFRIHQIIMELISWLNIWPKVMVLRVIQAGMELPHWNIFRSGQAELTLSLEDFSSYFMTKM